MEGADRVEVTIANPSLAVARPSAAAGRQRVPAVDRLCAGSARGSVRRRDHRRRAVVPVEWHADDPRHAQDLPAAPDASAPRTARSRSRSPRSAISRCPIRWSPRSCAGTNALIPELDPVGGTLSTLIGLATFLTFPQFAQMAVRKQSGVNDFEFLTEVAKDNGWEMYIDHTAEPHGRVLKFQFLIQDYAPSLTLKWGASLTDFTPRLTTVGDIEGVAAQGLGRQHQDGVHHRARLGLRPRDVQPLDHAGRPARRTARRPAR